MRSTSPSQRPKRTAGEILFSKIRRQLLTTFLSTPDRRLYFREIARLVRGSPGTVQRELAALTQAGVLKSELVGRQRYYSAERDCPIFPELRAIVVKTFGIADTLRAALRPQSRKIKIAFVYGSIASETQTGRSDVDVMVIGGVKLRDLASALEKTEQVLGRSVNPSVFSQKEFVGKIQQKNHFVLSVLASDKIFLIGGPDELGRLAE
ncbi:MAG: nucleotidyltransferase domain-containing protein [Candidatus Zixiibacteriota bacterium]